MAEVNSTTTSVANPGPNPPYKLLINFEINKICMQFLTGLNPLQTLKIKDKNNCAEKVFQTILYIEFHGDPKYYPDPQH